MRTSLTARQLRTILTPLEKRLADWARARPGEQPDRQPVHTVYGGAHLFKAKTTPRLGELALESFKTFGKNPVEFALGVGFVAPPELTGVDANALANAYASDPELLRQRHPPEG